MMDRNSAEDDQKKQLESRFGVQVHTTGGEHTFTFIAGGQEHTVDRTAATADGLRQAALDLQNTANDKIRFLERRYKVSFANPGEDAAKVRVTTADCQSVDGDMAHAVQPTLPQLFAVEEALKRSRPSQLTADGKQGVKIYFVDQSLIQMGPFGAPVKGLYKEHDKDGRPAIYMMPGAAELPPTPRDAGATPVSSLQWGIEHELSHNSQKNSWGKIHDVPDDFARRLGWYVSVAGLFPDGSKMMVRTLAGKDGKSYMFDGSDCHNPDWLLADRQGSVLGADGKPLLVDPTRTLRSQELHFTKEQVREQAKIKPISSYFVNPTEMSAESITAFRAGRASRARLLQENPDLYREISKYDERELAKFYGVDARGRTKYLRTPEGFVVGREPATEHSVRSFERENRFK